MATHDEIRRYRAALGYEGHTVPVWFANQVRQTLEYFSDRPPMPPIAVIDRFGDNSHGGRLIVAGIEVAASMNVNGPNGLAAIAENINIALTKSGGLQE